MSHRINSFNVSRFDEKDGVMTITAIARHVGPLTYRTDSGSRVELVPPDLIRGFDSGGRPHIAELAGAVATDEHPISLISYDNNLRQQVEVGRVKPKVKVYKDDRAEIEIEVYDSKTQDDIRAGRKRGISVGYQVSVVKQPGEWNGVKYDYIQTPPWRVDHVAIVANPRAPEALITRYDSSDTDIAWHIDESNSIKEDAMPKQVVIGDVAYAIADEGLANEVLMLLAQKRALEGQVEQLADELEESRESTGGVEYMDSVKSEPTERTDMKSKKPAFLEEEEESMDSAEETKADMNDEEMMEEEAPKAKRTKKTMDSLLERIDALESRLDAANAELEIARRLLDSQEEHEDAEAETRNDALETAVQNRLDELFATYEDARDYLPEGFKLDGSMTATGIMKAAIANFDSEIELHSDSAIEGAYNFMKKHHRGSSGVRVLRDAIDRVHDSGAVSTRNDALANVRNAYQNAWKGGSN